MPKTKQQKQDTLKSINKNLKESSSVVFCVFNKLPVSADQKLRAELKKEKVFYEVVKKTLLRKALVENNLEAPISLESLRGNVVLAASKDEVAPAKLIYNFSKDKEDFKILGGILNKIWMDGARVAELAKLPSKDELIAKVVGSIKAPLNGFANVMAGNLRGLVNTLNAIKNNKS